MRDAFMHATVIELLYFDGCPNHAAFLPHLRTLLDEGGVSAPVQLIRVETDDEAQRLGFRGSPTLRVNGVDVDPTAGGRDAFGLQCRLYRGRHGLRGTPPDELVRRALSTFGHPGAAGDPPAERSRHRR